MRLAVQSPNPPSDVARALVPNAAYFSRKRAVCISCGAGWHPARWLSTGAVSLFTRVHGRVNNPPQVFNLPHNLCRILVSGKVCGIGRLRPRAWMSAGERGVGGMHWRCAGAGFAAVRGGASAEARGSRQWGNSELSAVNGRSSRRTIPRRPGQGQFQGDCLARNLRNDGTARSPSQLHYSVALHGSQRPR
jgi:hypothetical protein